MTKTEALYRFFSGFGIPAYPETAVPDDVTFPYLTYSVQTGGFGETSELTVMVWYHTESEAVPTAKAEEIFKAIGYQGVILVCDTGSIHLTRGRILHQTAENDKLTKIRYMNVSAHFNTID